MTPRFKYTFLEMSEKPVEKTWVPKLNRQVEDYASAIFRTTLRADDLDTCSWDNRRIVFFGLEFVFSRLGEFLLPAQAADPLSCHLFSFSSVGCQITTTLHTTNGIYKRICHVTYLSRRKTDLIFFSTSTATHALLTPCIIRHWHIQ